jgi:hypothetical protein
MNRIVINSGVALSLQRPHHRAEQRVFVRGTTRVTRRDEAFLETNPPIFRSAPAIGWRNPTSATGND